MGYDACQRTKAHHERKHALLNPNKIPLALWEIISINLIRELPISQGFNTIYIIVNYFSKHIYIIFTNIKLILERIAKIYQNNIFKLYGILQKVISN